jgi:SAM-dependent methyltransferase
MPEAIDLVRAHYNATGLTNRIKAALSAAALDGQVPTVAQLAPLDQFHTRGILATAELAAEAGLQPAARVLDLGCGIGGPARYLADNVGCTVTGVDLSAEFIDAARDLTTRCGMADRVTFEVGDACHLPFDAGAFDAVFLQHVAMNIEDRAGLYAGVRRVLAAGGRFATYDIVRRDGEVFYPVPWARGGETSFLLTAAATRTALEAAGFEIDLFRDDTETALAWFTSGAAAPKPGGLTLGVVMGSDFPAIAANLARNIREGRLGVLSAVATRR